MTMTRTRLRRGLTAFASAAALDGSIVDLGSVVLPGSKTVVGTFTPSGTFVVFTDNALHKINVSTLQKTPIAVSGTIKFADVVYADGYFWGVKTNSGNIQLQRVDPNSGDLITGEIANVPAGLDNGHFGGGFLYGNGDFGFYQQHSGTLVRIRVTANSASGFSATVVSEQTGEVSSAGSDAAGCLSASTDLSLTKTAAAQVDSGAPIDYTLTVHNDGPADSSGWTVTDVLPGGVTNPTTNTPGCNIVGMTLTCTGGVLASGADAVIHVQVDAPASGTVTNSASVTANDDDPNGANDTGTTPTTVLEPPAAPSGDWGTTGEGTMLPGTSSPGDYAPAFTCFSAGGCDYAPGMTLTDHGVNGGHFMPGTNNVVIGGQIIGDCTVTTTDITCTITATGHANQGDTISTQGVTYVVDDSAPADTQVFDWTLTVPDGWSGDDPTNNDYPISTPATPGAPMADLGVAGGLGGAALLLGGAFVLRRRRQASQREIA